MHNAFNLGENVASIKGKTTNIKFTWITTVDKWVIDPRKIQTIVSYIMHMDGQNRRNSVRTPLELTLGAHIDTNE